MLSRYEQRFKRIGVTTVQDLLLHLPTRYENRTQTIPIGNLNLGDQALIEAEVQHAEVRVGRRRSLLVSVADTTGTIILRFFTFSPAQRERFRRGIRLRCYGEVRKGPYSLELVHPECQFIDPEQPNTIDTDARFTPIYPTTEGLYQSTWRMFIDQALELLEANPDLMPELLPDTIATLLPDFSLHAALHNLHKPPIATDLNIIYTKTHPAHKRLASEELLAYQISLRRLRLNYQSIQAYPLVSDGLLRKRFLQHLPFNLTNAQKRVAKIIAADLAGTYPMQRLLQGDVGTGKTIVAALAALQALEAEYQVALMVPTELLAEQHFHNICSWLAPTEVTVVWLKRQKDQERERILAAIAQKQPLLVIGTHALIQANVTFSKLGLIIIDEQHRFGVQQRLVLSEKAIKDGYAPHQLIMTATPIPRSLAMTAYADLDLSELDEHPLGRIPVQTVAVPDTRRAEVIKKVSAACAASRQAYWVCTLIEESDTLQSQAAEQTAVLLQKALGNIKVGLVHGRMKVAEREIVMSAFRKGTIGLLVATIVIEVGVDVPNASLIVIENPERLGLAQLHQLRGRVGRSNIESHCVLLYHPPLSKQTTERLRIIRSSNDGFEIARQDLALRGPGELLGTRQAGATQFRIADLNHHQDILLNIRHLAEQMLSNWPAEAAALEDRWQFSQ